MRFLLLMCLALLSCSPSAGWTWQRFTGFSDFGSFQDIDAQGAPWASTVNGVISFDDSSYSWRRVATPGANAGFAVSTDGHEFASTYGVYTRATRSEPWELLQGSRALNLEFVAADADQTVYAQTTAFAVPRGSQKNYYMQAPGSLEWTLLDIDARVFTSMFSPISGGVFVSGNSNRLARITGGTLAELPHAEANTFDFAGNRYLVEIPFRIQVVNPAGELEPWAEVRGAGTPVLESVIGFGKDGRFYAVVGSILNVPRGADYTSGDIVAIRKGEKVWHLAASPLVDGAGNDAGPILLSGYGGRFVRDGSMYWGACESGCAGNGNSFSYGLFRLTLGGQP